MRWIQKRRLVADGWDSVVKLRETTPGVFEELRRKIVRFINDNADAIRAVVPSFPPGLNDRAEDCWSPLAIADIAGGNWPELARKAAVALSADTDDTESFATKLLRALKEDFEEHHLDHVGGFQLSTDICDHLNNDTEAPWANTAKFKNKMTPELLAKKLAPYKIKSERPDHDGPRGFYWHKLKPVFDRYL